MGANKYQLWRQWSEEETCRWRGLNKTQGLVLQGIVAAVTPLEGRHPAPVDTGAAGGGRMTADIVTPPRGRQLHFDPMHDSLQADVTKDSQGDSAQKNFLSHFLKVSA